MTQDYPNTFEHQKQQQQKKPTKKQNKKKRNPIFQIVHCKECASTKNEIYYLNTDELLRKLSELQSAPAISNSEGTGQKV